MRLLRDIAQQLESDTLTAAHLAAAIEAGVLLVLIAVAAWIVLRLTRRLLRRAAVRRTAAGRTLVPVVEGIIQSVVVFAAFVLALEAVHVNVTALLASAGVLGVALGFGAQYLIRDVLAGVFLISEGIIQAGDIVRLDGDIGTVERVTLRSVQLRKANGELLTVPNGQIGRIGNLSRDYGTAMVRITVPYRADLAAALSALRQVAAEWAAQDTSDAQGQPVVDGAVDAHDAGVVLQLSVRVRPGRQWAVEAVLRERAIAALRARGIPIDSRVSVTL
jgi:small conductance mechanosensitive channel